MSEEQDKKMIENSIRYEERKDGIKEGIQLGKDEEKIEIARNLKKKNMDDDFIMETTGLTKEQIKNL